jgi:hypothetical protein
MPPVTKISSSVSLLRHALSSQWMWRTHSCILRDKLTLNLVLSYSVHQANHDEITLIIIYHREA